MNFTELPCSPRDDVRLRHLALSDMPAWFEYLSRGQVVEHTSWDVTSPEALSPLVWDPANNTPDRLLRLAVARREDDALVGTIGFHTVSMANCTAELAYDFSPTVWGRGIATALCRTMVAWAHRHVGLVRVQATVLHTNLRSQRVLERCSFSKEGLLRSYRMVRGVPGDFLMYAHLATSDDRALGCESAERAASSQDGTASPTLAGHLEGLERSLLDPAVRRSTVRVDALLSADFREFGSSGRMWGRQQVIDGLTNEAPVTRTVSDFRVMPLGPAAALVTYRCECLGTSGTTVTSFRSSTWRCEGGTWRMAFHQGTCADRQEGSDDCRC